MREGDPFKQECCGNCHFGQDLSKTHVLCRKKAPITAVTIKEGNPSAVALFPPIKKNQWCGEWKEQIHPEDN